MTKSLSKKAREVLWAFNSKFSWIEDGVPSPQFKAIAAVIRAAADQAAPVPARGSKDTLLSFLTIRHRLLAIADELDAQ